jgi:hypothetical protein
MQEIGIASMDLRFIDAKPLIGVYHSIYDTPFWIEVRTFCPRRRQYRFTPLTAHAQRSILWIPRSSFTPLSGDCWA